MKVTKKNAARLTSLSVLGAGALGVTAGNANAAIIYTPFTTSNEVGFYPGANPIGSASTFKAPVVPGISAYFRRFGNFSASKTFSGATLVSPGRNVLLAHVTSQIQNRYGGLIFRPGTAAAGQKWNSLSFFTAKTNSLLASRRASGTHFGKSGTFYKLFAFATSFSGSAGASKLDFGWIKLHQTVSSTAGPTDTIEGLAFDTTPGELIAAGDTGSSATPEPSTAALSLAALSLGAVGLRRWRAVRKQTTA